MYVMHQCFLPHIIEGNIFKIPDFELKFHFLAKFQQYKYIRHINNYFIDFLGSLSFLYVKIKILANFQIDSAHLLREKDFLPKKHMSKQIF
jgi:hypothetical protein